MHRFPSTTRGRAASLPLAAALWPVLFAAALLADAALDATAGAGLLASRAEAADPQQWTDGAGSCSSVSPVADATGSIVAWQSDCDPVGANADGSLEIFRAQDGGPPQQLTTGANCTSGRPSISANGARVAFESSCDLTGSNEDGNVEIFLWRNSGITQLTASIGCDNLAPSISGNGNFIAFDSTCNTSGTSNNGRGPEIFRVSTSGVLLQLTNDAVGDCDSTSASINDNGSLVAFDSDCDLAGTNEDRAIEVFTVTASGVVAQRTFAPDDSCSSVRPSIDGGGSVIAFQSDCDFTGANADRGDEIFTMALASGVPDQVTAAAQAADCTSGEAKVAASGLALAYSSWCKVGSENADKSVEVFQAGVGAAKGGILAVTAGSNCSSLAGALDASGSRVVFDSDCDPTGENGDGSVEVFTAAACACGAPVTRAAEPKASDALFALRAAVGTSVCAACECDASGDGNTTASDAQRILRRAVGQAGVVLDCPLP